MRVLTKSKLLDFRRCPKLLWLEEHNQGGSELTPEAKARIRAGVQVGDVARRLYDRSGKGTSIVRRVAGVRRALQESAELLRTPQPLFEAGFSADGAQAFADVMLPMRGAGKLAWRLIEVKSASKVKDYHREDVAIQAYIAGAARVPLAAVALAHVDTSWVYPGGEDYRGLLHEEDVTAEAIARKKEVKAWIADAHAVLRKRAEPAICTGAHCTEPWECGYLDYCQSQEPKVKYPVTWIPDQRTKALKTHIENNNVTDMRKVPDDLLNALQRRVKAQTLSGKPYFDAAGAAAALRAHKLPAYFLDFETISFAVPIWKGTRPYETIPFQFSVHRLSSTGKLEKDGFLDLSGTDPSRACAEALIRACGERGPVFAYKAGFERTQIQGLATRYPKLKRPLLAIAARLVDLHPITRDHYYHPNQQGNWSLKNVLPALAPDLRYDQLNGVQDGNMAMEAYRNAIDSATAYAEKSKIERQLREYCGLDTYAMVRIWERFAGREKSQI